MKLTLDTIYYQEPDPDLPDRQEGLVVVYLDTENGGRHAIVFPSDSKGNVQVSARRLYNRDSLKRSLQCINKFQNVARATVEKQLSGQRILRPRPAVAAPQSRIVRP